MRCYVTKCTSDAVTELRLRYQREGGTESEAVWEQENQAEAVRRQAIGAGVSNDDLRHFEHAVERGEL